MKKPRPIIRPIGPSIAYVPLTRGLFSLIEADDIPIVEPFCWQANFCKQGDKFYAQRLSSGMHRAILSFPPDEVDHRNGNTLDNRRNANLRTATRAQNQHNAKLRSDNLSGYKGVGWYPKTKKWHARIRVNGKRKFLGFYPTPEEAHSAYCRAANELHGTFARFS